MDRNQISELKKDRLPDSRMAVQMLDDQQKNNKFYLKFLRNCEETNQRFAMAPDLLNGVRIQMSVLGNMDCPS